MITLRVAPGHLWQLGTLDPGQAMRSLSGRRLWRRQRFWRWLLDVIGSRARYEVEEQENEIEHGKYLTKSNEYALAEPQSYENHICEVNPELILEPTVVQ